MTPVPRVRRPRLASSKPLPPRRAQLSAVACALWCAAWATAQAPAPRFHVDTIDGTDVSGAIAGDSERLTIGTATVALADIVEIRRDDAAGVGGPAPGPICLWLRSGGVLPATRVEGATAQGGGPVWRVTTMAGAVVDVPMTTVAALRCRPVEPETFAADRAAPDENSDYLFVVKDGKPQRFRVTVSALRDGSVHFELGGKPFDFPLDGVDSIAAIVFGKNTGFAPDRQPLPRVRVTLATGENVAGRLVSIAENVTVHMDEGGEFTAKVGDLLRLEVATDKLQWLAALPPRAEQTAAFDRKWPWTIDSSPAGPGIRVGGRTHARGLVLVPRTRLTWDLGGRFDRFEATLGIDERGGPQAHAVFRVFADGKLLHESTASAGSGGQAVRLDLGRCKELAIEADFGKNFDLGDLCAFADARVVRT